MDHLCFDNRKFMTKSVNVLSTSANRTSRLIRRVVVSDHTRGDTIHLTNEVLKVSRFLQFKERTPITVLIFHRSVILRNHLFRVHRPTFRNQVVNASHTIITRLTMRRVHRVRRNEQPNRIVNVSHPMVQKSVQSTSFQTRKILSVLRPFIVRLNVVRGGNFTMDTYHAITRPTRAFIALQTINQRPTVVAASSPVEILVSLISRQIKYFGAPNYHRLIVGSVSNGHKRFQFVVRSQGFRGARAVVGRAKLPARVAIFDQDVGINRLHDARVNRVRQTIFLRRFNGLRQCKFAFLSFRIGERPASRILPRIRSVLSVKAVGGNCQLRHFLCTSVQILLYYRFTHEDLRRVKDFPYTIIRAIHIPAFRLRTNVVFFTVGLIVYSSQSFQNSFPEHVASSHHLQPIYVFSPGLHGRAERTRYFRSQVARERRATIPRGRSRYVLIKDRRDYRVVCVVVCAFVVRKQRQNGRILTSFLSIRMDLVQTGAKGVRSNSFRHPVHHGLFARVSNNRTYFVISANRACLLAQVKRKVFTSPNHFPFQVVRRNR